MIPTFDLANSYKAGVAASGPLFNGWSPVYKGTLITLSNGDLTAASTGEGTVIGVYGKSSGNYYWEVTVDTEGPCFTVGVAYQEVELNHETLFVENIWTFSTAAQKSNNASSTNFGAIGLDAGDVCGIAMGFTGGAMNIWKNGVLLSRADSYNLMTGYTAWSGTIYPAFRAYTGGSSQCTANFGATAFAYNPPELYDVNGDIIPGSQTIPMYGP